MPALYPLRFTPRYRRYLWGGRRLESMLGKPLGPGADYAESWEIVDHGPDQSILANGPLHGRELRQLVADFGAELFGQHHPQTGFPLLFKFLDAQRALSVQVHPNDRQAARLKPPDRGKTEAWVILDREPGSVVYAGLLPGIDPATLQTAIAQGRTDACLHRFEPRPGDCIFIPAGTAHALGAGLLVAEIQQASDTTFRLFDWNRLGVDGQPRPLHVEQALAAIDYLRGPVQPQVPQPTARPGVQRLIACEEFVLDRWQIDGTVEAGGDERFHLLAVLDGELIVAGEPSGQTLARGQTLLLPAAVGRCRVTSVAPTTMLDMYLPEC
jgi:mannose-6-phosphate isomerase